jgi:hypothetical protein
MSGNRRTSCWTTDSWLEPGAGLKTFSINSDAACSTSDLTLSGAFGVSLPRICSHPNAGRKKKAP